MITDAIVLRAWPYSETTLIVSLLTREAGVQRVLAKGARRLKGRSAAAFDLFAGVRVKLRPRSDEGLGMLGSVDLRDSWLYLREDLLRLALASAGLEVVGAVAEASPPEPYFFDAAREYLALLERARAPGTLTAGLLLRLLFHAGYPPRMAEGLEADRLPPRLAYDFSRGEIVAAEPGPGLADDPGRKAGATGRSRRRGRWDLARGQVERIRPWLADPPEPGKEPELPASQGGPILLWLLRVWEDHLNQRLRAAEFLERSAIAAPGR